MSLLLMYRLIENIVNGVVKSVSKVGDAIPAKASDLNMVERVIRGQGK